MDAIQSITFALLGVYYAAYAAKALTLKRRGIAVNLLGKGEKPKKARAAEQFLRFATLAGAVVQLGSVLFPGLVPSLPMRLGVRVAGMALMLLGNLVFIMAMRAMRSNWRAGFEQGQNTSLVTNGIYRFSRNPAFVGFDLLYLGCAAVYPNVANLAAAIVCAALFHMQILGEEAFCAEAFGQEYAAYKAGTGRYFGKKRSGFRSHTSKQ